jgi:hypothetical protein
MANMNRTRYDTCAYSQEIKQSVGPGHYVLDPVRYEHCNKCRHELGLVGGTAVSHVAGNLVDLENDLRGQNRPATKCPAYKFIPRADNIVQGKEYIKPVQHPAIDTSLLHLPACQMIKYAEVPAEPAMQPFVCANPYGTPGQHRVAAGMRTV